MAHYGIGPLLAVVIWSELGDPRRFSSSRQAVRHTGLDVTVHSSDAKRTRGFLSRQGPPALRWALYEAAICAARTGSPDHHYYLATKARLGAAEPPSRWPASSPPAATTRCASWAGGPGSR